MLESWKEWAVHSENILISPFLVRLRPRKEVDALSLSPFAHHPPRACKELFLFGSPGTVSRVIGP